MKKVPGSQKRRSVHPDRASVRLSAGNTSVSNERNTVLCSFSSSQDNRGANYLKSCDAAKQRGRNVPLGGVEKANPAPQRA